jgi:ABC-type tungstate transport system substrate-binding protein
MPTNQAEWIRYAITGLVIGIILFIRWRRMGQVRRLRLETLWIIPTIFTGLAIFLLIKLPPPPLGWLWIAIALALGSVAGWHRGRFIAIGVDPETHELNQKSSPAAMVFLLALVLVRLALRSVVTMSDARWHLGAGLVADIFLGFAVGVLTAYRVEIFLRARRLLGEARGG